MVVSSRPVFYFVPAKQEADAGVNAGDLILIRLEEKAERRQFEIAAHGAWRSSSDISLTHQLQLFRSEVKSGIYKIVPALSRGEYALYLSRGEGMAPYVYDFSVQDAPTSSGSGSFPASAPPAPVAMSEPLPSSTGNGVGTKEKKPGYQCTEYTVDRLGLKNCTKWAIK
jgi:hypothetical protein